MPEEKDKKGQEGTTEDSQSKKTEEGNATANKAQDPVVAANEAQGEATNLRVSDAVADAALPESQRADPSAPLPGSTDATQPSEEMEPVVADMVTDPTPGAVTAFTKKTTKAQSKKESTEPIPVGTTVRLAESERIPERWWGADAVVVESPIKPAPFEDDLSPRARWAQDPRVSITVKTLDAGRATLSVLPEDLDLGAAQKRASGSRA